MEKNSIEERSSHTHSSKKVIKNRNLGESLPKDYFYHTLTSTLETTKNDERKYLMNTKRSFLGNQLFGENSKLKSANLKLNSELVMKDIEILNLNSIYEQLIKSQENKNEMLKYYCKENHALKVEIGNLRRELEGQNNRMKKMKFKIKYYKKVIRDIGMGHAIEKIEKETENEKSDDAAINVFNKSTGFPPLSNVINEINEKDKRKSLASNTPLENRSRDKKFPGQGQENKRQSVQIQSFKPQKGFSRGSVRIHDHYKRLTLNHPLGNNDNMSLQLLINGQKSLFRYNADLVSKIIHSNQFNYLEKTLLTYDVFKHNLETIDETKLDEVYFIMKGVVNDYKSTLTLLSKINKLLEVQHIFCERVKMTDIFEKICDIVCQTLECDRTTLYLVDNVKKELWSKAAKDSSSIIKLPFGKGLAGYVAENRSNLVLDDAYFDPRFNKDYDTKTGYRTKSVLCVPIFDYNTKEVIGVIQSLNKKIKPHIFDVNDEITSELLSRMIGSQLKQSMEFSDYAVHENKLKKLLSSSHEFFISDSLIETIKMCTLLIKNIFSTEKTSIFINLLDHQLYNSKVKEFDSPLDNAFYKYKEDVLIELKEQDTKLGLVGKVIKEQEFLFTQSTYNNDNFNPAVDIDTSLPLITIPIFHPQKDLFIGVVQLEYNVARLGISDFRITHVDHIDYNIITLLIKIFSLNLVKFFNFDFESFENKKDNISAGV